MNFLDKTIGWFSPERAYKRIGYRQAVDEMRSYDAASDDHLNQGWRAVNAKAETTDGMYRDTIRARSRDLERNSDILESVILAFERNVVGGGFTLQAKTENEELDTMVEALFKLWCRPKNCDVTQQQSFTEICKMIARRQKVDGGMLIVMRYIDDGVVPLSLQLYEVDDLDTMIPLTERKRVVNGIEYNAYNRPVAYYLKKYDPYGNYNGTSERIDAKDVLFLFQKKRPSQLREMSELSSTIPRVRDMNQFMEAVSVKERVAALLAVLIKRMIPGANNGQFAGRGATEKRAGYNGKMLSPGMIMELNPGDDVHVVQPPAQAANSAEFIRLQQRLSGASQGISYEVTARDMSQVNYSSARQGLLEDQKTYLMQQQHLIDHFLTPIYEAFIEAAVLAGKISIKDFYTNKERYLQHEWIAPGMKWIDPLKEANANKIMLENNLTTLEDIAASTGKDWRELVEQRAIELEYMALKGVISSESGTKAEEIDKLIEETDDEKPDDET
ncbi:phage portal protein [Sporosarcina sp. P18a]|uniref:phage portal protein n=1 Tax=Sporosarcina sp. P18a TaxID=2048259 RepID=UPI000C16A701|nr:phage portal protein [Sporosarcina sp. P18a]PIC80534.1 phage portal protein [Sporosarcina sp. P18a]